MSKRFKLRLSKLGNGMITDTQKREDLYFDKEFLDATLPKANEWLNALNEENEQLKSELQDKRLGINLFNAENTSLMEENEQLKQFKEKVFNIINKKLHDNEKLDGVDTAMYYANRQTLNELKKELEKVNKRLKKN